MGKVEFYRFTCMFVSLLQTLIRRSLMLTDNITYYIKQNTKLIVKIVE